MPESESDRTFETTDGHELTIPEVPSYEDDVQAELDDKLVDALETAEAAGNVYLAHLLRTQLGSHRVTNGDS